LVDLPEEIPALRASVEGIQDHVAGSDVKEAIEIAGVRVGHNDAVPAHQHTRYELANGRALPGAGGADEFEMLGFVLERDAGAGEREFAASRPSPTLLNNGAALVRRHGTAAG
jgi:hypothetical protein